MEALEKLAINKTVEKTADIRSKPENTWEYFPLLGLIPAIIDRNKGKITIFDSSKIKPNYFFGAWAVHLSAIILGLNYIEHQLSNYFQN